MGSINIREFPLIRQPIVQFRSSNPGTAVRSTGSGQPTSQTDFSGVIGIFFQGNIQTPTIGLRYLSCNQTVYAQNE
jgi:hypothetical protein